MPSEFDIIRRYFSTPANPDKGVVLGTGDDAAILRPPAGHDLVMAVDTLINGVHFPED
ncbi:MAG TPA: thiamine-phosphate kinase, partial [Gammaproteobacteria bacterium]|nr:thiamine-phosphate kinase [Gammaproteobacteria bacterium]